MDEKLDDQDFPFVPLPRYKFSVRYNCFLYSPTWLYSKENVCAAKKNYGFDIYSYYMYFKYYFKYQVIINNLATLQLKVL